VGEVRRMADSLASSNPLLTLTPRQLYERGLSRRDFLRAGVAGSALLALAACAPSALPAITKPKRGGTLRVSHPNTPANLDPALSQTVEDMITNRQMYEGLVESTYNRQFIPLLAESWSTSADLKTWTFHLRQGVKFFNGKVLDAQDVVYTMERVLNPTTGSQGMSDIDPVASVVAVDALTVQFNLKYAYSDLLAPLSETFFGIVPNNGGSSLSQTPNGTGPFLLSENVANDHITFVRNPNYWQKGLPYLDTLILVVIPQDEAELTSLANHETDVMWTVPFELFDEVKATRNVTVDEVPTSSFAPFVLDNSKPPFNDPNVRMAFRLAIDAEQIVKVCLDGHGTTTPIPIAPNDPVYPHVPVLAQNISQAQQLMVQAGYPNGFSMPIYAPNGRPAQTMASVVVAQMLQPLKVTVNIQDQPLDYFFAHTEGNAEAYMDDWTDQPGVDLHIYSQFHSGGFWNELVWKGWTNQQANAALDAARISPSVAVRKQQYGIVADALNSDGPGVFYYVSNVAQAWQQNVHNIHARPGSDFIGREVWVE
jgi:peptide/nickel transport system substrate-binding protein